MTGRGLPSVNEQHRRGIADLIIVASAFEDSTSTDAGAVQVHKVAVKIITRTGAEMTAIAELPPV